MKTAGLYRQSFTSGSQWSKYSEEYIHYAIEKNMCIWYSVTALYAWGLKVAMKIPYIVMKEQERLVIETGYSENIPLQEG